MRRRLITLSDGRTTFIEDDEGTTGVSLTITDGVAETKKGLVPITVVSDKEIHDDREWERLQKKHPARAKVKDINKDTSNDDAQGRIRRIS